jgi:malonyl CoA-acyl carrier protein transacylase
LKGSAQAGSLSPIMSWNPQETALLFPTGGYHWPGMGADVDATYRREIFDRAQDALAPVGVVPGALRRLMAGHGQARRARDEGGWSWSGDFPLSMVAQMALGVALAEEFIEHYGPPRVLAGESMGELAAYCVAGALALEDTALLTYRWAADLQTASARLGLRMAVIEDLAEAEVGQLPRGLEGNVVVAESPHLLVMALPSGCLDELDRAVIHAGGHTLVSNNPCAAHEPRLAGAAEIWEEHERFLSTLPFRMPRIPLLSTLFPGELLAEAEALRKNRVDTTFLRVRWDEVLRGLPALGIRRVVQFGPASSGYALKKFRSEDPAFAPMRISIVATLAALAGRG